jgi:hypothetical protein
MAQIIAMHQLRLFSVSADQFNNPRFQSSGSFNINAQACCHFAAGSDCGCNILAVSNGTGYARRPDRGPLLADRDFSFWQADCPQTPPGAASPLRECKVPGRAHVPRGLLLFGHQLSPSRVIADGHMNTGREKDSSQRPCIDQNVVSHHSLSLPPGLHRDHGCLLEFAAQNRRPASYDCQNPLRSQSHGLSAHWRRAHGTFLLAVCAPA